MKDIHFNNWVTDTSSQNFHKLFDNIHYHNILRQYSLSQTLRQTLKWQIINRCINEVSQQSISMLNYSTSLLQYLHLNTSSDYETVMKQFFIAKHLIINWVTKHLITTSTNWVTDISSNSSPNSSSRSSSHFSSDLHSPQYFHNNFIQISSSQTSTNYFWETFMLLYLQHIFNTTSFTNSLSQSLSDRCFDKLFTNIQMSYISYNKHSQTLYHKV